MKNILIQPKHLEFLHISAKLVLFELQYDLNVLLLRSDLKVQKIENFFGSDFEFCTISLLVLLKY